MDDLEVDLDDAPEDAPDDARDGAAPGAPDPARAVLPDARPGPGRLLRPVVVLPVAAAVVAAGLLVAPRLLPEEPPPRVTVDYVSPFEQDGRTAVDLHTDAAGRPTGPTTMTVTVALTAVDVPPGVRAVEVTGPAGPAVAPADRPAPVGAATGWKGSGQLTFAVRCEDLPDAPDPAAYTVRVSYERPAGRRTTTAGGSLATGLPALLGRICTARTLRGDVTVTAVEALPDRSGLRVTVENRGRRTVWLRSVLDGGSARDAAGPGTSVHVVRLGGTACGLMSVLLGGGVVGADGTTQQVADSAGSLRIGLMGSLSKDAVGPGGAVMPVGFSAAAERSADGAMRRLCGA